MGSPSHRLPNIRSGTLETIEKKVWTLATIRTSPALPDRAAVKNTINLSSQSTDPTVTTQGKVTSFWRRSAAINPAATIEENQKLVTMNGETKDSTTNTDARARRDEVTSKSTATVGFLSYTLPLIANDGNQI